MTRTPIAAWARAAGAPPEPAAEEAAASAFSAVTHACRELNQDAPGRPPLERALAALAEGTGSGHVALYEGAGVAPALCARTGPARAPWLPRRWDALHPARPPAGQLESFPLPGAQGVEGLLVVWQPHEGPQAVALRAALHDGAAALGAALARRRELEVLRRRCPEDLLTGSFSARAFAERLEEEVDRARRYGVALGLVLTDVDHMEALNQRHGRPAGDAALAALADLLRAQARRFDALGRTGGDELAWLLPETDAAAALRCGERLRRAVAAHAFPRVGRLSVSAGAASLPRLASDAAELREAAERSLALAKKCGRNRVGPGAPTAVH